MHDWFLHPHAEARRDASHRRADEHRLLVAIGMDLRAVVTGPALRVAEQARHRLEERRASALGSCPPPRLV